jgi:hypothetical protein
MAKYIDKIKEDVILLEKLNIESSSRKKLVFNNIIYAKNNGEPIKLNKMNISFFLKNIILDDNYSFSFFDFLSIQDKNGFKLNYYLDLTRDLIFIKSLVNENKIRYEFFEFSVYSLYCQNFDFIINLLKPMAKSIQSYHNYKLLDKNNKYRKLNIKTASDTIEIFFLYNPRFGKYLKSFLYCNIRNAFAHSDFIFKNHYLFYDPKNKHKKIKTFTLLNYLVNIGLLINNLQGFEFNYRLKSYNKIIKNNINTKKKVHIFLKEYKLT